MIELTIQEVNEIKGMARTNLIDWNYLDHRLPDMKRELQYEEAFTLAYVEAVLNILNKKGAIKDGWLDAHKMVMRPPHDYESMYSE